MDTDDVLHVSSMRRLFHDANNMAASLVGNLTLMKEHVEALLQMMPGAQAAELLKEMDEMVADNLDCVQRIQAILKEIRAQIPASGPGPGGPPKP